MQAARTEGERFHAFRCSGKAGDVQGKGWKTAMKNTYLYAASFEPDLIKIGRSKTPALRLRSLKCQPGASPDSVRLQTGRLLSVTRETSKQTEPQVHARLRDYRQDGCLEWFMDCDAIRAELSLMGFSDPGKYDFATKPAGVQRVGCVLPGDLHHRLKVYTTTHKLNMGDWIRNAIHRTLTRAEAAK